MIPGLEEVAPLLDSVLQDESAARFERKFIVPVASLQEFQSLFHHHSLSIEELYPERRINNIYLDTPGFRYYRNSVEGLTNRLKVRIRWYGETFQHAEEPALEIKLKNGFHGYKLHFPLAACHFHDSKAPDEIIDWLYQQELPTQISELLGFIHPVLVNTYVRSYWTTRNGLYRLTLDRDIQYSAFLRNTDQMMMNVNYDHHRILEIKNHPDHDEGIDELTTHFLPRITRYSKYTNGVDILFYHQSMDAE